MKEEKMAERIIINSQSYWEERFSSGSWEENEGEKQSEFFARIAVSALPDWLIKKMKQNNWTMIDYGCAKGAGTSFFAKEFPSLIVTGIDFSESAVEAAKEIHTNCSFKSGDITSDLEKADIVFSSNTLEHLKSPRLVLENLIKSANKYAVLILPFEDRSDINEHISTFDIDFFPEQVEEYCLQYFKIIDCRIIADTRWLGKQILVVYADKTEAASTGLEMSFIYKEYIKPLMEEYNEQSVNAAQKLEEYSLLLAKNNEEHESTIAQQKSNYENTIAQQKSQYENTIAQQKSQYENTIAQQKSQYENTIAQQKSEYESILEQKQTEFETIKADQQEKYDISITNLQTDYDTLGKRSSEIIKNISHTESNRRINEAEERIAKLKEISLAISSAILQQEDECQNSINRVTAISRAKPYRLAHLIEESKHAFFGNREDQKKGKEYLFHNRSTVTRYNYPDEIRNLIRKSEKTAYAFRLQMVAIEEQIAKEKENIRMLILRDIMQQYDGRDVYVMPVLIDWNVPLFQRPQQIAMGLAHNGALFIYLSGNVCDNVTIPVQLEKNLYLAFHDDIGLIFRVAKELKKHIILDMYSTGNIYNLDWMKQWNGYDYTVLYEYVDEISEEISGIKIPEASLVRHKAFLHDPDVYVVATAEKLFNEVRQIRGNHKTICSSNGVDIAHFQIKPDLSLIPLEIQDVIHSGKPIIGYFGAIAVWFDYDLIYEAAKERPDYFFLLIGPQYGDLKKTDAMVKKLSELDNIMFTGTIAYNILPNIANHFTVATIPFLLNDITESTSPIKLFEYMAMGKPVVTTAMRECFKYPEVMIAHNPEEYVVLLDRAVDIVNSPDYPDYKAQLLQTAYKNSWDVKAKEIIELIKEGEKSDELNNQFSSTFSKLSDRKR